MKLILILLCICVSSISTADEVIDGGKQREVVEGSNGPEAQDGAPSQKNYIVLRETISMRPIRNKRDKYSNRFSSMQIDSQGRVVSGSFCCSSSLTQCLLFSAKNSPKVHGKIYLSKNREGQLVGTIANNQEVMISMFDWDYKKNKASNFRTPTAPTADIREMQCVQEMNHSGFLFDGDHGNGP